MVAVDLKLSLSSGNTSGLDPASHDGTSVHSSWNRLGKSVVMNNERIGVSSDFWNNYAQDIRLAKELGMPVMCFLNPCGHVTFETDCALIAFASVPLVALPTIVLHIMTIVIMCGKLLLHMLTVASVSHKFSLSARGTKGAGTRCFIMACHCIRFNACLYSKP